MKYLYQDNMPGMVKFWKMLEQMVEENYVTEENEDDYLVFGLVNYLNIEQIKRYYLEGISYRKLIVYQLEPLVPAHWWSSEAIINNIRNADEIWDYDLENIEILQREGFDPKFRPCRYTKLLNQIQTVDNPKIDLLLYATPTDSRIQYYNYICHNRKFEYNCAWMTGIQGEELDYFMSNSKIILNLSTHYKPSRQAQTRIFEALIKNKCVISQSSEINYFGDSLIEFNNPSNMMSKIETVLTEDIWKNFKKTQFNPSIFYNSSKIAIFIYIDQTQDWINDFFYFISSLQNNGLYDNVDYIQTSFSSDQPLDIQFYKINRIRYDQKTLTNSLNDLYNFAYLNPDYKLLFLNNSTKEDLEESLKSIQSWKENLTELDRTHIMQFSTNNFWINSKLFCNESFVNLANFMSNKLMK